jgi:hypothetical protein
VGDVYVRWPMHVGPGDADVESNLQQLRALRAVYGVHQPTVPLLVRKGVARSRAHAIARTTS